MNSRLLLSVASLAFTATLSAQTAAVASLSTADAVGVNANRVIDAARAGTAIPRGLRLSAMEGRQASSNSAAAPTTSRSSVGAMFAWNASAAAGGTAGTVGGMPLAAGAQSYTLDLNARAVETGRLLISFNGRASGARAGASVRVGREVRTFSAAGGAMRAMIDNLRVDSRGLRVAIEIIGSAPSTLRTSAAYGCTLNVSFVASPVVMPTCTLTPNMRSCAEGGVLVGRAAANGRTIDLGLSLSGALPNAIGVTLASLRSDTIRFGATGCLFFTNPVVLGTFNTDANGDARAMQTIPAVRGMFYLQQATLLVSPRGFRLATSNTLEGVCN